MKIKDVIKEGQVWDGVKQAAKGVGGVAKGLGGIAGGVASHLGLSPQGLAANLNPNYKKNRAQKSKDAQLLQIMKTLGQGDPASELERQYKIIHPAPHAVVTNGKKKFTRDEQGNWVFFGTNKPVSRAEEFILDKVSPMDVTTSATKSPTASELPVQSTPTQAKTATPNYSGGATSIKTTPVQTGQAAPQAAPAQQPATNAKVKINRATNGDVTITDKNNVKWTKPNGKNYWTSPASAGAGPNMVMPGSPEYARMDSLVANLREGQQR